MKTVFMLFLHCLFCAPAISQVRWAAEAGMVSTTNHYQKKLTGSGTFYAGKGFVIGGSANYTIFRRVSGESGLNFQSRNFRYHSALIPDYTYKTAYRLQYLVLNQNLLVMTKAKKGFSFGTGTGFFLAYGLSGRYRSEVSTIRGLINTSGKLKLGNGDDDDLRRFDMGINVVVRSQYKNIRLTMQLSPSLTKNQPETNKSLFTNLSFTAGYLF